VSPAPPYFSVIVPMYNRERFIGRALASCLAQDFSDFEIVVVDDGSEDGSREAVGQVRDPRIRLVCHGANQGRCPSRNTGMSVARGEWLVFLDSDDELLPGSLRRIRERARGLVSDIGSMRFMCRDDADRLSPDPPHRDETLDYEGYVRWMESVAHGRGEAMSCARRETFPMVRYSDGQVEEGMYNLEMARRFRVQLCPDVLRLYHQDAENRVVRPTSREMLAHARDGARDVEEILVRHRAALQQWAPTELSRIVQNGMLFNFLAGRRVRALMYARWRLGLRPVSPKTYAILLMGLLGPAPLAFVRAVWTRGAKRSALIARRGTRAG
jgi:glycosyltransferase involved in cell wall biosynthesis